jgi:hypothetical protein
VTDRWYPTKEKTRRKRAAPVQQAPEAWTLVTVGDDLAVTNTTVRHLLNGVRYPSIMLMRRIEREYGWPILEQIHCIPDLGYDNRYADEFRRWLDMHHAGVQRPGTKRKPIERRA